MIYFQKLAHQKNKHNSFICEGEFVILRLDHGTKPFSLRKLKP
jgi:hypothetical protein